MSALSLAVLWCGWVLLAPRRGLPLLQLLFAINWMQIAPPRLYRDLTGRTIADLQKCDATPMGGGYCSRAVM